MSKRTDGEAATERNRLMVDLVNQLTRLQAGKRGGRYYADIFLDEPSADEYPEYYQIIQKPMALNTVRKRAQEGKYTSFDAFSEDLNLVFSNAMYFNEEGSQVYNDAKHLQKASVGRLEKQEKVFADYLATSMPASAPTSSSKSAKKRKVEEGEDHTRSVKLKISLHKPAPAEKPQSQKIKLNLSRSKIKVEEKAKSVEETEADEEEQVGEDDEGEDVPAEDEEDDDEEAVPPPPPPSSKRGRGRPRIYQQEQEEKSGKKSSRAASVEDDNSPIRRSSRFNDRAADSATGSPAPKVDNSDAGAGTDSASAAGATDSNAETAAPAKPDDSRLRGPGKTINDALITHFSVSSHPKGSTITPYHIVFPPHESEVFQSFTIILPPAYSTVTISPTLSFSLLARHYNLYMSLNNRRLSPTIVPGNGGVRKANEPPKSFYEVNLAQGVNVIECLVHASPPAPPPQLPQLNQVPLDASVSPAPGTPVLAASPKLPTVGGPNMAMNGEGSEKERIVVWIILQRT
ncbi:uncharacterized protein V1516DRAFT_677010 [Lipomyces oligophaga]|uniref:uncharacterized protein n=1 Tax=Lipomyces oligophaga TaxID=45792 RepID=UPI0034CFA8B6